MTFFSLEARCFVVTDEYIISDDNYVYMNEGCVDMI